MLLSLFFSGVRFWSTLCTRDRVLRRAKTRRRDTPWAMTFASENLLSKVAFYNEFINSSLDWLKTKLRRHLLGREAKSFPRVYRYSIIHPRNMIRPWCFLRSGCTPTRVGRTGGRTPRTGTPSGSAAPRGGTRSAHHSLAFCRNILTLCSYFWLWYVLNTFMFWCKADWISK